jgi:hypothetical protein
MKWIRGRLPVIQDKALTKVELACMTQIETEDKERR